MLKKMIGAIANFSFANHPFLPQIDQTFFLLSLLQFYKSAHALISVRKPGILFGEKKLRCWYVVGVAK